MSENQMRTKLQKLKKQLSNWKITEEQFSEQFDKLADKVHNSNLYIPA